MDRGPDRISQGPDRDRTEKIGPDRTGPNYHANKFYDMKILYLFQYEQFLIRFHHAKQINIFEHLRNYKLQNKIKIE